LDTVTKLNFKLGINELRQYYDKLNTDYQHLDWSWEKCGNDIVNNGEMLLTKILLTY